MVEKIMHIFQGKCLSKGKATGKFLFLKNNSFVVPKTDIKNTEQELLKFQKARADAMNQLQSTYEKALGKVGENDAKIFVIQQMMIHENGFTGAIRKIITSEGVSAQYAVYITALKHMDMLEATNDEYMMARTADVHDVSQRIIRNIRHHSSFRPPAGKNLIVYKKYFSPSEIIEIDPKYIKAVITLNDSSYSHSAILARTMKLPRITSIPEEINKFHGKKVNVDADNGEISLDVS